MSWTFSEQELVDKLLAAKLLLQQLLWIPDTWLLITTCSPRTAVVRAEGCDDVSNLQSKDQQWKTLRCWWCNTSYREVVSSILGLSVMVQFCANTMVTKLACVFYRNSLQTCYEICISKNAHVSVYLSYSVYTFDVNTYLFLVDNRKLWNVERVGGDERLANFLQPWLVHQFISLQIKAKSWKFPV